MFDLADESTPTPEQQAIDHDRVERLQKAMSYLSEKDRKLLELAYFEGYTVREAGRELGWQKSSADRHHQAALKRLRSILGSDRDLLGVEIGLAAWVAGTVGGSQHDGKFVGLDAGVDLVREATAICAHRVAEVWRKLYPFSDPGNAAAASGSMRAAGACGAAAVACIASGVIGPGVGGVDLVERLPQPPKREKAARIVPEPQSRPEAIAPTPAPPLASTSEDTDRRQHRAATKSARREPVAPTRTRASTPQASAAQTVTEFGVEGGSSPAPAPSSPSTGMPSPSTSSSGSSSKGSDSSATSEFGL